ncbi:MAG: hypothetical protein JNK84_02270 [Phreatobacter sp.]|uniref:hypothetical protein n=1 Tax=Phreatobacter sp. TaxID=1966341 RepID=UPI001A38FA89|nr:hypothetical protein [Phreatobacter sp.]MBL8567887.1 hypothetical protein [Phreatobacter sp.]
MTARVPCPIAAAFSNSRRAGVEIERLIDDFRSLLRERVPAAFDLEYQDNEEEPDWDWSCFQYTEHCSFSLPVRGRRRATQIALHFDLARRQDDRANWAWADCALLAVAYAPLPFGNEDAWDLDSLAVGATGLPGFASNPRYQNLYELHAGGRVFSARSGSPSPTWMQRSWGFGVPLMALSDRTELVRHAVDPFTRILIDDQDAEQALAGTAAVIWSSPGSPSPARR